MPDEASDREARAAQRRDTWSATLSTEHAPMPLNGGTAEDRFRTVVALSRAAWRLSGQPWPRYDRANMPSQIFRTKG